MSKATAFAEALGAKLGSFGGTLLASKKIVGAILVAFVVAGAGMMNSAEDQSSSDQVEVVDATGKVDPNLYESRMMQQPEPKPEPAPKEEKLPELPPVPVSLPAPPKMKAEDVFQMVPPRPPDMSDVAAYNAQRRGKAVMYLDDGTTSSSSHSGRRGGVWESSQEDWPGEGKSVASYPVDMSRVFTTDKMMTCLLETTINSELPGTFTLVVEQNLFGGKGRLILIPAGSKLVGYYKPMGKAGDQRLALYAERLITPDGINVRLVNAEIGDAQGRAGVTGEVDSRFFAKYGLPLMIAAIDTAAQYKIAVDSENQANVVQNFGTSSANISRSILEENMNLKPVVEIPAASRVQVRPMKDIWFKPPRNGTVQFEAREG